MGTDRGRRAEVLACFDESSTAVFASLCRMFGGDANHAMEALVQTYCSSDIASADPLVAAARVFLATSSPTVPSPVASARSPIERTVAELSLVRHLSVAEIAAALDRPLADIADAAVTAVEGPSLGRDRPAVQRHDGEVWFDDAMRSTARAQLSDRCGAPEPTPASQRRSRHRTNALIGAASAALGAALVLWVAAANRSERGSEKGPQPPASLAAVTTEVETTVVTPPGVVASGTISSIGENAATGASTTAATATTTTTIAAHKADTESTTVRAAAVPPPVGFVLDPAPDGFAARTGLHLAAEGIPHSSWQSVWSSDGATRSSGRWFATAVTDDHSTLRVSGGESGNGPILRFTSGARRTQMFIDPDGVQHAIVQLESGQLMQFTSFGVSADQIATMVGSAAIGDDRSITFGPAAATLLDGLSLRSTIRVGEDALAPSAYFSEDFRSWYGTPDSQSFLLVSSGSQQPNDLATASLLLEPSTDPLAQAMPDRTVDVSGHAALVGQWDIGFGSSMQVVMWHQGGRTVMVRGTVGLDVALQAARGARPASADEWQALLDARSPLTNTTSSEGGLHAAQVGSRVTRAGSTWTVRLNDNHVDSATGTRQSDGEIEIAEVRAGSGDSPSEPSTGQWYPLYLDPTMPLTHFESIDATVLVVSLSQPTDVTTMRVTVHNERRVEVPIIAVPDTQLAGAAYAYSEEAPFTVELLDASGAVLQTLPP